MSMSRLTQRAKLALPRMLGTGDDTIATLLEARRSIETETMTDPEAFWIMAKILVSNRVYATLAKPDNVLIDVLASEFWDATQSSPLPVFIPIHHKSPSPRPRWTLLVIVKKDSDRRVWMKHYSCSWLTWEHEHLIQEEYRDYFYKFGDVKIDYINPVDPTFPKNDFASALYTLWVIDRIMVYGVSDDWGDDEPEKFNISQFQFERIKPVMLDILDEVMGLVQEQRGLEF
ncbi:hypothetical protein N3K66_006334 [Trichothecium roseum]|uniref:Uncharacterized protein n=1 Tax=Trichothecium roseum TaxID=47278 RepID=A0ACC0UV59_9HYPO|nr:hypothetical protein N3K66_006334 [Trichothecium roseum]